MSPASQVRRRRGQALVEFAAIALVLAVMLGAMLSLGHMFFAAHTIQQAVDVAAQEIARTPFPAASELGLGSFEDKPDSVMETELFREQIFDERHLVIDPDDPSDPKEYVPCGKQVVLTEIAARLPLLNRLLVTAMIHDQTYDPTQASCQSDERSSFIGVFRYPGAIVAYDDNGVPRETVVIPLVKHDVLPDDPNDPNGPDHLDVVEKIVFWVKPVEEIHTAQGIGPFSVAAHDAVNASFQPGMVALRINYPFQAAGLVRYVPTKDAAGDGVREMDRVRANNSFLAANDAFSAENKLGRYSLVVPPEDHAFSIFGGRYGLGSTGSYRQRIHTPTKDPTPSGSTDPLEYDWDIVEYGVRPYRRVITAQAIYRREVFE